MSWQPIETAPEGIPILISNGETVECAELDVMPHHRNWFAHTGTMRVWVGDGDRGGLAYAECEPTHWMPLPEPPTSSV